MEKSVKSEIYFYLSGVKSLTQLHRVIVKDLTHGDCFLWNDEPELIAESKANAERLAMDMIQRNLDAIPTKVKRDF